MPNSLQSNQERCVVCSLKDQIGEEQLQFMPDCHCSYDPLQYPCFFPYGTDGWHYNLQQIRSTSANGRHKTISLAQYLRFHIECIDAFQRKPA